MTPAEERLAEVLDQKVHFALIEQKTNHLTSQRHRAMIDCYLEHTVHELIDHDIDALMATVGPDPAYFFFGLGAHAPRPIAGRAAVREFYLRAFTGDPGGALNHVDRIVADDQTLVLEGVNLNSGARLARKHPEVATFLDTTRVSVVRKRVTAVLPFETGLIVGERLYHEGPFGPEDVEYLD